ncbi:hypothetical protein ACQKWADRAFT_63490 [Trichoderma austrokoningii]
MTEDDEASPSRPSSSASSDLLPLEKLIQDEVNACERRKRQKQQREQEQEQSNGGDDGSHRPTSSSSSDVIIIDENNTANNNKNDNNNNIINIMSDKSSSSSHNSSRRSSGTTNNDTMNMDVDVDIDISVNTTSHDCGDVDDINDDNNAPIPPLVSISAAIFVPIPASHNLLKPLNLTPGSATYHRAALDVFTRHEASVRDNLNALFHREMYRVRADVAADLKKSRSNNVPPFDYAAARAHVRAREEHFLRRDGAAMIANMRAPAVSSVTHGATKTKIPVPDMNVPVTYAPVGSPREFVSSEIMKVIAAASGDLVRFDERVRSRRAAIKRQIRDVEASTAAAVRMDID